MPERLPDSFVGCVEWEYSQIEHVLHYVIIIFKYYNDIEYML